MRYRITSYRVWLDDKTELASVEVGRSPFLAPAGLDAEKEKILEKEIDKLRKRMFVDVTLKSQHKEDEETDD